MIAIKIWSRLVKVLATFAVLALLVYPSSLENSRLSVHPYGPVLILTEQDVLDLQRVVDTEVAHFLKDEDFIPQLRAVLDTILNRWASRHWGLTLRSTVNSPWQFSMINSNLPKAWGAVQNVPPARIHPRVSREVKKWLERRAAGTPSTVGDHLHYLNLYYSSERSKISWGYTVAREAERIGYVFGAGRAKHWHFTDPKMNAIRPGPVRIIIEKSL